MPEEEESKKSEPSPKKKPLELPPELRKGAKPVEKPVEIPIVLPPELKRTPARPVEKPVEMPIVLPSELKAPSKPAVPPTPAFPKLEPAKKPREIPAARRMPEFGGPNQFELFLNVIAAKFPRLKKKLKQAEIMEEPNTFIANALAFSVILAFAFIVLFFIILDSLNASKLLLLPLFAIVFGAGFSYWMKIPDVKLIRQSREIDKDLVFAGRHMLIELHAGVPLFDAMLNITRDYGEVSKAFARILEKINAGVPADVAMHDIADDSPSLSFKRVMLQLVNSLRSGSNVAESLEVILDQVSREQVIEVKAYGQKLSPLAMFYMVFGIIIPSLGIALAITLMSFLRLKLGVELLVAVFFIIAIIQYIFLTMIESSRPKLEI